MLEIDGNYINLKSGWAILFFGLLVPFYSLGKMEKQADKRKKDKWRDGDSTKKKKKRDGEKKFKDWWLI